MIGLLCFCMLLVAESSSAATADIKAIEQKILANRGSIKRIHGRIDVEKRFEKSFPPLPVRYEVWHDGERYRQDVTRPYEEGKIPVNTKEPTYIDRTAYNTEGECITYSTAEYVGGAHSAVTVDDRARRLSRYKGVIPSIEIENIGLTPRDPTVLHYTFERFIGNPERKNLKISDEQINGVACKKISYQLPNGSAEYWVAPSMDYNIVKWNSEWYYKDKKQFSAVSNIHVKKDTPTGRWFPESIDYQRTTPNGVVSNSRVAIKDCHFNEPINQEQFAIAGLGVPVGTPVYGEDYGNRRPVWDGKKVQRPLDELSTAPKDSSRLSFRTGILLNVALISMILAALFLRRRLSLRKQVS